MPTTSHLLATPTTSHHLATPTTSYLLATPTTSHLATPTTFKRGWTEGVAALTIITINHSTPHIPAPTGALGDTSHPSQDTWRFFVQQWPSIPAGLHLWAAPSGLL
ncbi:Hypothetical predicted protein [Marmota monax]|uniref:Uncharacterized protein n=1 Tax=Marmota monax TaxID=9995 RepID=A0A5E4B0I9_MARMO|nr:Hypothetical predicted protein [Marmota monax]